MSYWDSMAALQESHDEHLRQEAKPPTICVDFDGVIHSYTSGWKGARCIPDPPVDGAIEWVDRMCCDFHVAIYSSRSHHWLGRQAMRLWLRKWGLQVGPLEDGLMIRGWLSFPKRKPPAIVYIDDRAWRFQGPNYWPNVDKLMDAANTWQKNGGTGCQTTK